MDWLNNIKSFIEVIELQGFSKVAEKRFTSAAAISRHISGLEKELGVKLIRRTTRALQLTEEGKLFFAKSKHLLTELEELKELLKTQKQHLKGPLKITMPFAFSATQIITRLMVEFSRKYPQIELTLDFSNDLRDLTAAEIDVAFRAISYRSIDYKSIPIAKLKLGVYAAPDYLRQYGAPRTLKELEQHQCLLHTDLGHAAWEFKKGKKQIVNGTLQTNSSLALINFAKAGLGIVRILENYVTNELHAGALIPLLTAQWPEPTTLYLVYRSGATTPLRVQAFVDFIKSKPLDSYWLIE